MAIPMPEVSVVVGYATTTMASFTGYIGLFAGLGVGLAVITGVIHAFKH